MSRSQKDWGAPPGYMLAAWVLGSGELSCDWNWFSATVKCLRRYRAFCLRVELAERILLIFITFLDVRGNANNRRFGPPCKVHFAETSVFVALYEDSGINGTKRNLDHHTRTNYLQDYLYDGAGGLGGFGSPGASNERTGVVVFPLGRGREGQIDLSKCPRK